MATNDVPQPETATPELAALNAVVRALRTLSPDLRRRVIDSALILLGGSGPSAPGINAAPQAAAVGEAILTTTIPTGSLDIRQLKEQKSPDSANDMAALVAYYLTELVAPAERKETVDINDLVKYFKQAQFRLPSNPKMILVNAKNAGYFDSAGGGQYRLNPVGYNLVVHSLPRSASGGTPRRKRSGARAKKQPSKVGKKSGRRKEVMSGRGH